MGLKQIDFGTPQYAQMVKLRNQILREPLGLTLTAEELDTEKDDILVAAFDDDVMMGCCILTPMDASTLRLRQMAVPANLQGKGIGASILSFAEDLARDKGYSRMIMHARDTAIGFYEKFGFRVIGEPFTEVDLPHHIMEKVL